MALNLIVCATFHGGMLARFGEGAKPSINLCYLYYVKNHTADHPYAVEENF